MAMNRRVFLGTGGGLAAAALIPDGAGAQPIPAPDEAIARLADGSVDATGVLQAVLDRGGVAHLPAGTYRTTAPLRFHGGQLVLGAGRNQTVIEAHHDGDILTPADPRQKWRGNVFGDMHLTKPRPYRGSGRGLALSFMREARVDLRITHCAVGIHFVPRGDGNWSYFNRFEGCEITDHTQSCFFLGAEGTDLPNANMAVGGNWRSAEIVCHLTAGGTCDFLNVSFQDAGSHWLKAEGKVDGLELTNCRFENSGRPLAENSGLYVEDGVACSILGGTMAGGVLRPSPETSVVNLYASGRFLSIGRSHGVERQPLYSQALTTGVFGNLLARSREPQAEPWRGRGVAGFTTGLPDPHGGKGAVQVDFGGKPGTSPSYGQTVAVRPGTRFAFGVEMRAADGRSGLVALRVRDETNRQTITRNVWCDQEWRYNWVPAAFSETAEALTVLVTDFNDEGHLDSVIVCTHTLVEGSAPGLPLMTGDAGIGTGSAHTDAEYLTVGARTGQALPRSGRSIVFPDQGEAGLVVQSGKAYGGVHLQTRSGTHPGSGFQHIRCDSSGINAVFSVRGDGQVASDGGAAMNTPADYAEMFEWTDGNPENEDRVGLSVIVEMGKIRPARSDEEPHGIVSGNPAVLGDSGELGWVGAYIRDAFNRPLLQPCPTLRWRQADGREVSYPADAVPDGIHIPENAVREIAHRKVVSPDYDPSRPYVPRSRRPEWAAVGLLGKLALRKGQPVGGRWIRLGEITDQVERWLVR